MLFALIIKLKIIECYSFPYCFKTCDKLTRNQFIAKKIVGSTARTLNWLFWPPDFLGFTIDNQSFPPLHVFLPFYFLCSSSAKVTSAARERMSVCPFVLASLSVCALVQLWMVEIKKMEKRKKMLKVRMLSKENWLDCINRRNDNLK